MDQFYENKCEELYGHIHQILNKKEENILQLRLKIAKTVNLQQTTNSYYHRIFKLHKTKSINSNIYRTCLYLSFVYFSYYRKWKY